jgi:hypothetical protein
METVLPSTGMIGRKSEGLLYFRFSDCSGETDLGNEEYPVQMTYVTGQGL